MKHWILAHSRTWWIGIAQIVAGTALAVTGNVDAYSTLHAVLMDVTGHIGAWGLISMGMGLIGLRSAVEA